MSERIKLDWDGEVIKQHIEVEDIKLSPKDIIDSIDHVSAEIEKMTNQKEELKKNLATLEDNIKSAKKFKADREKFENKCEELCISKLAKYYKENKETWKEESEKDANEIIAKDPSAYTDQQKENQKYVIFQKKFATYKKVAEKIPNRLIRQMIFEEPFYENPFN